MYPPIKLSKMIGFEKEASHLFMMFKPISRVEVQVLMDLLLLYNIIEVSPNH